MSRESGGTRLRVDRFQAEKPCKLHQSLESPGKDVFD